MRNANEYSDIAASKLHVILSKKEPFNEPLQRAPHLFVVHEVPKTASEAFTDDMWRITSTGSHTSSELQR